MKAKFVNTWNRSKQPRKQRKYRANAPLHIKRKLLSAHLSKELRKKYNKRSLSLRKGDKVRVLVGDFKGKTGVIESIDLRKEKVLVRGIEVVKKDGTKVMRPINPSNLEIIELNLDDNKRKKILERKTKSGQNKK